MARKKVLNRDPFGKLRIIVSEIESMNSFEKIYKVVAKIPRGKVATYKQIAKLAGINPPTGGPRVVGFALHSNKNPDQIPCHRVVNIKGELTGYAFGGIKKKREILEKEGIKFDSKGKINLKKFLFR